MEQASHLVSGIKKIIGGNFMDHSNYFKTAWSVLYLMVNGRAAIKQFKILPLGIAGLVGANAFGYGREFFFPRKPVTGFSL